RLLGCMGGTSFTIEIGQGRVFYTGEPQITRILNPDLNPDPIRVICGSVLWLFAFAFTGITALLLRLFRLGLRLRSRRCGHTLTSWLLLSHRLRGTFSLRCALMLDPLLLTVWLLLFLLLRSWLWLLHASSLTLFLPASPLLNGLRSLLALITHLELLSLRGSAARDHSRVVELFRDARRDINLAATPRGVHHCIPQRRHQQRIQHRIHRREHVSISFTRASPVNPTRKVVDANDRHRARHVEIHNTLVQIVTCQILRLPRRVVIMRDINVARTERHPTDLILVERNPGDERGRVDRIYIRAVRHPVPAIADEGPTPVVIRRVAPRFTRDPRWAIRVIRVPVT